MCFEEEFSKWPSPLSSPRTGGWKGKMEYQKLTFQGHLLTLVLISDRRGFKEVPWEGEASLQ